MSTYPDVYSQCPSRINQYFPLLSVELYQFKVDESWVLYFSRL